MDESTVFVKFGPRETQEIPLEWAEKILTEWAKTAPAAFGKYLQKAALGS